MNKHVCERFVLDVIRIEDDAAVSVLDEHLKVEEMLSSYCG